MPKSGKLEEETGANNATLQELVRTGTLNNKYNKAKQI